MKPSAIVLVDEGNVITTPLSKAIKKDFGLDTLVFHSFGEFNNFMLGFKNEIMCAVTSMVLKDAPNGELAQLCSNEKIPFIILTASYDEEILIKAKQLSALGCVMKSQHSLDQIIRLLTQIHTRKGKRVLVVDDSVTSRAIQAAILNVLHFTPVEANDGVEALEILQNNPDISMVITDYEMPRMNGVELVAKVRQTHHKENLPIIGISASDNKSLSVQFLKHGASDFLKKPYLEEEYQFRVMQCLEIMEHISMIRKFAYFDSLTQLHNRRFFFDRCPQIYSQMVERKHKMSLAMMDVDHFKKINDTYGHDGGDLVLKKIAELIKKHFPQPSIPARFGGEEFCVFIPELGLDSMLHSMESFREGVAAISVPHENRQISTSISIGITENPYSKLEEMISMSDRALYKAKQDGRNRVVAAN